MGYLIEHHIVRKCEVLDIFPFLDYKTFLDGRKGLMQTPTKCFNCGHVFSPEDKTYLGVIKHDRNRIFCEECGKKILSKLEL